MVGADRSDRGRIGGHRRLGSAAVRATLVLGTLVFALAVAAPAASADASCPCSLFEPAGTPTTADFSDTGALSGVNLGVAFTSDEAGFIDGVSFYKGDENTGTHIGTLWSSSGTALAQATFADETASGWQTVYFPTPVPVSANTTYVASYWSDSGFYAVTPGFFTSGSFTNGPLTAPGGSASNPNGLFVYAPVPTFPTGTFNGNNYDVDVVFTPTPLPQSIAVTAPSTTIPDQTGEQLTATATFGDGTTSDITSQVTWSTSPMGIAAVSATGALSALMPGATMVGASLYGVSGTLPITVTPSPTVTNVSPNSGPTTGGGTVTITGTDFATGDTVDFGTTPSSSVTVSGSTSISATVPHGSPGPVDVTVTDPTSLITSPTNPDDVYTYAVPLTITTQPSSTTVGYATTATFTAAASGSPTPTVQWQSSTNGGSTWTPISGATSGTLTIADATYAQSATEYEAVFTNSGGSVTTRAATLTVVPVVSQILPSRGGPFSLVFIKGNGFDGAKAVDFGSSGTIFLTLSNTIIIAISPIEKAGTVDVTVRATSGASLTSKADQFTFVKGFFF